MDDPGDEVNFSVNAAAALAAGDLAAASEYSRQAIPVQRLMGLEIVELHEGTAVLTMELSDNVRGASKGTVHGGLLATFADVAAATALIGTYDSTAEITVTTDMHVRYYRQPQAGPLVATGTVVHQGRRLLGSEVKIVDANDRVLVRATATYMLVPWGAS